MKLESANQLQEQLSIKFGLAPAPAAAAGVVSAGADPGVTSVGVAQLGNNDYGIVVGVRNNAGGRKDRIRDRLLLSKLGAAEFRIEDTGPIVARLSPKALKNALRAVRAAGAGGPGAAAAAAAAGVIYVGDSIGHANVRGAGTVGPYVESTVKPGPKMILSANHVLVQGNSVTPGRDFAISPGGLDGGRDPRDRVGPLAAWEKIVPAGTNDIDAAAVEVLPGRVPANPANLRDVPGIGTHSGAVLPVANLAIADLALKTPGTAVVKRGRTTGVTRGHVRQINIRVRVDFTFAPNVLFQKIIEIDGFGGKAFAKDGDSGSCVLAPRDGQPGEFDVVGLVFAVSTTDTKAYVIPIETILATLKLKLA